MHVVILGGYMCPNEFIGKGEIISESKHIKMGLNNANKKGLTVCKLAHSQ